MEDFLYGILEDIHLTTENLAIIGNFNLHLEITCSKSKTLHSLINSFDLIQKVNFPTHIHGHTLDQVLTKTNNDNISNVHTTDAFSDHLSVSFSLNFLTYSSKKNATVSFPKYHKIDKEKMKADLLASELINNHPKNQILSTNNITPPCQPLLTNMLHYTLNIPRQSTPQDGLMIP